MRAGKSQSPAIVPVPSSGACTTAVSAALSAARSQGRCAMHSTIDRQVNKPAGPAHVEHRVEQHALQDGAQAACSHILLPRLLGNGGGAGGGDVEPAWAEAGGWVVAELWLHGSGQHVARLSFAAAQLCQGIRQCARHLHLAPAAGSAPCHSLDAVLGKNAGVLLDQRVLGLAQHVGQLLLRQRLRGSRWRWREG